MFDVSNQILGASGGGGSATASTASTTRIQVIEDLEQGIIRVSGTGNWSPAMVEQTLTTVDELKDNYSKRGEIALILIDMRQANIQQANIAARFMNLAQQIDHMSHRIAVLVDSSLIKMEMKKTAPHLKAEFFLSPSAALTWLTAYRGY